MSTNYTVSSDVDTLLRSTDNFNIRSNIGAATASTVATLVTDVQDHTNDILNNYNMIVDVNNDISLLGSDVSTNSASISNLQDGQQQNGESIATKAPITSPTFIGDVGFKANPSSATNLVDIKKLAGKTGARVGINMGGADAKCALHVTKSSSDGLVREAMRVTGGAYFTEWVNIGNFTDTERDTEITAPEQGLIIYNTSHHEWQGYIEEPGNHRWVKFNTSAVST